MNPTSSLLAVTDDDLERTLTKFRSDHDGIVAAYKQLIIEVPNLGEFLSFVRDRAGQPTFQMLWLRIWTAMEMDAAEGTSRTITALCDLPRFDRGHFMPPPTDPDAAVAYYARALESLAERARS